MAKKVFLDPGHGGSDPGAVANGLKEKDLTLKIAKAAEKYLKEKYEGVTVKMSRTGDSNPSLSARAKAANDWGADYFVSIHINSGGGTGFESYIFNGTVSSKTKEYQKKVHQTIVAGTGWTDRGMKRANFAVLRETKMPAILTENGFIDRKEDAAKLKDSKFIDLLGKLHAEGIAKALGLKKKSTSSPAPDPKPSGLHRVIVDGKQTGAFAVHENVINEVSRAIKAGAKKVVVEKV